MFPSAYILQIGFAIQRHPITPDTEHVDMPRSSYWIRTRLLYLAFAHMFFLAEPLYLTKELKTNLEANLYRSWTARLKNRRQTVGGITGTHHQVLH